MGDRANFVFIQDNGNAVVLYGHWAGHNRLSNLANAVERARPRWNDDSYATRIAVSQLIGGSWDNETGWGIAVNTILDNEYDVPCIDWNNKLFTLHKEDWANKDSKIIGVNPTPSVSMSLEDFVKKYRKTS